MVMCSQAYEGEIVQKRSLGDGDDYKFHSDSTGERDNTNRNT